MISDQALDVELEKNILLDLEYQQLEHDKKN